MKRVRIVILAVAAFAATFEQSQAGSTDNRAGKEAFQCEALGLELRSVSSPGESAAGLVIVSAREFGRESGLRRGDRILTLNGRPLDSAHQLCRISGGARASHVITVERDGVRSVVPLFFQGPALRWGDSRNAGRKSL